MIIEKIEYSDKYNLIRLTISGERFYIDYDLYFDLDLKQDNEVDFDTYKLILAQDEYNKAKIFALKKISYSQKSTYEIRKKLKENKFGEEAIEKVIAYLDSYGFLDDKAYVKSYIKDKDELSKWSKNKIIYALKNKHIDQNLIDEYISLIDDKSEVKKAMFFASKKFKGDYSFENRQKIFRHLASKGFEFNIINEVLDEIFS